MLHSHESTHQPTKVVGIFYDIYAGGLQYIVVLIPLQQDIIIDAKTQKNISMEDEVFTDEKAQFSKSIVEAKKRTKYDRVGNKYD